MRIKNFSLALVVLCLFLTGCSSLSSTQSDLLSDSNSANDKVSEISLYIDSTKEESIQADQSFEAVTGSHNKKIHTTPFNSLEFDITEEDALVYAKSSALMGDSPNEYMMLSYLGYENEIDKEELTKAENYLNAKDLILEGKYSQAYQLLRKYIDYQDSEKLAKELFDNELVIFQIGDIGPAGGYIFYDKGSYSDGWRFLEAAPNDYDGTYNSGTFYMCSTSPKIGRGKSNTKKINNQGGGFKYVNNGFSDWFIPSKDELNLMYMNLKKKRLGNFKSEFYLSSSIPGLFETLSLTWKGYNPGQPDYAWVWIQNFGNGEQSSGRFRGHYLVRPTRAF